VFDVPVVLTTVGDAHFSGIFGRRSGGIPESDADRAVVHEMLDIQNFVAAIKATGRIKIVLAGL